MSNRKWYPGDSFPNLAGTVSWSGLMEITAATASIHVGSYTGAAKPWYGAVTISDVLEGEAGSSFNFSYDVAVEDTVAGEYDILLRVVLATGEIETIKAGTIIVSEH